MPSTWAWRPTLTMASRGPQAKHVRVIAWGAIGVSRGEQTEKPVANASLFGRLNASHSTGVASTRPAQTRLPRPRSETHPPHSTPTPHPSSPTPIGDLLQHPPSPTPHPSSPTPTPAPHSPSPTPHPSSPTPIGDLRLHWNDSCGTTIPIHTATRTSKFIQHTVTKRAPQGRCTGGNAHSPHRGSHAPHQRVPTRDTLTWGCMGRSCGWTCSPTPLWRGRCPASGSGCPKPARTGRIGPRRARRCTG